MSHRLLPPPHPFVWTVLYFPFGALGGFVSVALTYLGTKHGLSVTETSLLNGANLLSQWWKWSWAPMVDVTLTPKRWYMLSVGASALGVLGMSAIPLSPSTLPLLLAVIASASLVNTVVGMAIESIMAAVTPPDQVGRTSAWFQAGNLGGAGLGGGLGLILLERLPEPWMAGGILALCFLACAGALLTLPDVRPHVHPRGTLASFVDVVRDIRVLARTKGGLLSAFLCFLPVGTGAAQGTLAQASVAADWGAGANEVAIMQGVMSGIITAIGAFAGGWLCDRMHPRTAYSVIGLALAAVAVGMGLSPHTVTAYIAWNMIYSFGVGLAYAAFTAVVLTAIGSKSAATKYTVFASLSNFPIWYLGLLLGRVADVGSPTAMLLTEAALGVAGVALFFGADRFVGRSRMPDHVDDVAAAA